MKYNNKKTVVDGITFDSKMESEYYQLLKAQKECGLVETFKLQPVYLLQPSFKKLGRTIRKIEYIADFLVTYSDGSCLVIDVKGVLTDAFKLKAKLFDYYNPSMELKLITKHNGKWIDAKDKPKRQKKGNGPCGKRKKKPGKSKNRITPSSRTK